MACTDSREPFAYRQNVRRAALVVGLVVIGACSGGPSDDELWAEAQLDAEEDADQCILTLWDEAFIEAYDLLDEGRYREAKRVIDHRWAFPEDNRTSTSYCIDEMQAAEDEAYEAIYGEPRYP